MAFDFGDYLESGRPLNAREQELIDRKGVCEGETCATERLCSYTDNHDIACYRYTLEFLDGSLVSFDQTDN